MEEQQWYNGETAMAERQWNGGNQALHSTTGTPIKFRACEKKCTLSNNYVHYTMLYVMVLSLLLQGKMLCSPCQLLPTVSI